MLVKREFERLADINKNFIKKKINVKYKQIATRTNRAGIIREINKIQPLSRNQLSKTKTSAQPFPAIKDNEDKSSMISKIKINLKGNRSNSEIRTRENNSRALVTSSSTRQLAQPNHLMLETNMEQRKDLVDSSHTILRREISILDKVDEKEKLIEFIKNEQEKLTESRKAFELDKESYEKYLERMRIEVASLEEEVRIMMDEKEQKESQIHKLNQIIHDIQVESNKVDDNLAHCKNNKVFIDEMLEFKGVQKSPKYHRKKSSLTDESISNSEIIEEIEINEIRAPYSGKINGQLKQEQNTNEEKETVFITRVQQPEIQDSNKFIKTNENGIKFDKQKFKETFIELEEENLFMMNQIQEKELQLEEFRKSHEEQANAKKKEIKKSEDNVERLKSSLALAKSYQTKTLELTNKFPSTDAESNNKLGASEDSTKDMLETQINQSTFDNFFKVLYK